MRAPWTALTVLGLAPAASGATINFEPPVVTVEAGVAAVYRVSVGSSNAPMFSGIDLLFSVDLPDLDLSFTYDPSFETSFGASAPTSFSVFPGDLFVGGVNLDSWEAPVVIGTLRVETAGLDSGTFDNLIWVRPDVEAALTGAAISVIVFGEGAESEELSGVAHLVVVSADSDVVNDGDTDGDGTGDDADAFPEDPDETADADQDGAGDNADPDDDNDGVEDTLDDFPAEPGESADTDGDGTGNNADADDDDDGVEDVDDAFPLDPQQTPDADGLDPVDGSGAGDSDVQPPASTGGPCGVALLGPMMFTFLGLAAMRRPKSR